MLEETPSTMHNCSAVRRRARALAPEQKRNVHQYVTVRRAKASRMLMGTVKRPTCKVKGQVGADEPVKARVARLAECRQNRRRVMTRTPATNARAL